jgi:hypothetical protein
MIRNDDFHHIETKENIRIIKHSQPGQRTARNSLLFFSMYRFHRPAKIFARTRFYFDEYQRVVVTTDNIDLTAATTTKIAEENFVTVTRQIAAR